MNARPQRNRRWLRVSTLIILSLEILAVYLSTKPERGSVAEAATTSERAQQTSHLSLRHRRREVISVDETQRRSAIGVASPRIAGGTGLSKARIVNGSNVTISKYPYFVLWGGCGATLVYNDIALSAAHCSSHNEALINPRSRDDSSNPSAHVIQVRRHPFYDSESFEYDFAVLKLNGWFQSKTVRLNDDEDRPGVGDSLRILGFGGQSSTLKQGRVEATSSSICVNHWARAGHLINESSVVCAMSDEGISPCTGDSGGPLLTSSNVQVGVISSGSNCDGSMPAMYSRVSAAKDWIKMQICQLSDFPPADCLGLYNRPPFGTVTVRVDVHLDHYPQDIKWRITSKAGGERTILIADAEDFLIPNSLESRFVHLQSGAYYDFIIEDVSGYADGLGSNGKYKIVTVNRQGNDMNVLVSGGDNFQKFESVTFAMPEPTKRPSPKPTRKPNTSRPTPKPTRKPNTSRPTPNPTRKPSTSRPTPEPTRKPNTSKPTPNPTRKPSTSRPTPEPTRKPSTSRPTPEPTRKPSTSRPTPEPTRKPSTSRPTPEPTRKPSTSRPTDKPTLKPVVLPTKAPTINPTDPPTKSQTSEPTRKPTNKPTKRPTKKPITSRPTSALTDEPTSKPTKKPTRKPTIMPTKVPTDEPTLKPTKKPTRKPTIMPTKVPTDKPTLKPTKKPTRKPTIMPTKVPTDKPTLKPTRKPTIMPTKVPTDKPTLKPTKKPTQRPTKVPTKEPDISPTDEPALNEDNVNSDSYKDDDNWFRGDDWFTRSLEFTDRLTEGGAPTTNSPTAHPTVSSSPSVSFLPSNSPSKSSMPSLIPIISEPMVTEEPQTQSPVEPISRTVNPTEVPTSTPIALQTGNPIASPTTKIPSYNPTDVLSNSPTDILLASRTKKQPSDNPTDVASDKNPSATPSTSPIVNPSASPTTNNPSAIPSARPTVNPSASPSASPTVSPTIPVIRYMAYVNITIFQNPEEVSWSINNTLTQEQFYGYPAGNYKEATTLVNFLNMETGFWEFKLSRESLASDARIEVGNINLLTGETEPLGKLVFVPGSTATAVTTLISLI